MDVKLGDIVRLRKKHPCGSDEWQVERVGVDIRIRCLGCQRRVLEERAILERKIKALVLRINPESDSDEARPLDEN
jgi:hypothetical protein